MITCPLCKAGLHPSLWEWTATQVADQSDMENYLRAALADQALGIGLPFVTIEQETGTLVEDDPLREYRYKEQEGRDRMDLDLS